MAGRGLGAAAARAVLLDFNGTLSDDEPILFAIYAELFAREGRPLTEAEYRDRLAGLAEDDLIRSWLGAGHPRLGAIIAERIAMYRARVRDGRTIGDAARAAVRYAAARVPVGIVSGAAREEIEPVVRAAGLSEHVAFVVAAGDVVAGKPDPEGYVRALERLGGLPAEDVVAVEDTEAGIAAARAAGLRVVAVAGTLAPERLAEADALVEHVDLALMRRLLAGG